VGTRGAAGALGDAIGAGLDETSGAGLDEASGAGLGGVWAVAALPRATNRAETIAGRNAFTRPDTPIPGASPAARC
jgi:hypothetical protein